MNKTFILSALAGSLMLTAASCSSDEPNNLSNGEGTTFTVNLPEDLATRVLNAGPTTELGNGLEAKNLFYAIYLTGSSDGPVMQNFDATGYNYVPGSDSSQPIVFADGSLSVTFTRNLVKGKTYEIVFWAQNPDEMGTPYSYDLASRDLTVNYDDLPSYGQTRDAFYATKGFTNDGNSVSATLYRPFAQINIGTADLKTYMTLEKITSPADIAFGMTVTNVANTINLSNNDVTGSATVIAKANQVTANLAYKFPVGNEYDMLATAFVLTPKATSQVCDVTLNIDGDAVANAFQTYTNVPIQGNFRTNIYGNLLTCPTDFVVTKDPTWNTPDYEYDFVVSSVEDLQTAFTNGGYYTLNADINFSNQAFVPAGSDVVIDLNNHNIDFGTETAMVYGSLILKNGTVSGGNASSSHAGIQVGVVAGETHNGNLALSNVTVDMTSAWSAIGVYANSTVSISNSNITGRYFGVSTDAATNNQVATINIDNTTINGQETAVLCNQPGTVNINNCVLKGSYQGVFMRCGTLKIDGGKIESTATTQVIKWNSGNEVPKAAITLGTGTNGSTNYLHPTTVDINNVELITANDLPGIYAQGYNSTYNVTGVIGKGVVTENCGAFIQGNFTNLTINAK